MAWTEMLTFIQEKDPAFLQTVRGVSRTEIERVEAMYAFTLPKIYVDFIETMGASFGTFEPFGATQICEFPALVQELSFESYPKDHYFKVSINDAAWADGPRDKFLDLWRSDGHDAPLVWFEDVIPFIPETVEALGYTLGEWLTMRVFDAFDLDRRPHIHTVTIVFETARKQKQNRAAVLDLLDKMGFRPALPPLAKVTCLQRSSCSIRFKRADVVDGLTVKIGAQSQRDLDIITEQLRDHYPFLTVRKPGPLHQL